MRCRFAGLLTADITPCWRQMFAPGTPLKVIHFYVPARRHPALSMQASSAALGHRRRACKCTIPNSGPARKFESTAEAITNSSVSFGTWAGRQKGWEKFSVLYVHCVRCTLRPVASFEAGLQLSRWLPD